MSAVPVLKKHGAATCAGSEQVALLRLTILRVMLTNKFSHAKSVNWPGAVSPSLRPAMQSASCSRFKRACHNLSGGTNGGQL